MSEKIKKGYTGYYIEPRMVGKRYHVFDIAGKDVTKETDIYSKRRREAFKGGFVFGEYIDSNGNRQWRKVAPKMFKEQANKSMKNLNSAVNESEPNSQEKLVEFIHKDSLALKPERLMMEDLSWKLLVRSAFRGKNIMMTGHAGSGKTFAAQSLHKALKRPYFYFNLGATQDPRATLIGNTHFKASEGTMFNESTFVKAIQTENAIVLLDELSRAHPEAGNILMTVLDQGQRYLRLDEEENSPVIKVADGVTFVATANIGNEYTSTRTLDRALKDRFQEIEMKLLTEEQEFQLLSMLQPDLPEAQIRAIAQIAVGTREATKGDDAQLSDLMSTRSTVEMAELMYDGFTLEEAAEVLIYPMYEDDGADSERTYVKQLVQRYLPVEEVESSDESETKSDGDDFLSSWQDVDDVM